MLTFRKSLNTALSLAALVLYSATSPFWRNSSSPQAGMVWLLRIRTVATLIGILVCGFCGYGIYTLTQP